MLNIIESKRQKLEEEYDEAESRLDKYMSIVPDFEFIVEEARDLYAIQSQLDLLDNIEEELEDMKEE